MFVWKIYAYHSTYQNFWKNKTVNFDWEYNSHNRENTRKTNLYIRETQKEGDVKHENYLKEEFVLKTSDIPFFKYSMIVDHYIKMIRSNLELSTLNDYLLIAMKLS